ncbi:hypothetical protein B0H12DRAFT_1170570 [Mycena haematopus]|nr:hypothetical protein B0H12DRAFT_1170570 [Mycena haematopus]
MASCSLNFHSSFKVDASAPLQPGFYAIYNKAAGKDRLASFNLGAPLVLFDGSVPLAFTTWRVSPVPGDSRKYRIANIGTCGEGILDDGDIVIAAPGRHSPLLVESVGKGEFLIKTDVPSDGRELVWHLGRTTPDWYRRVNAIDPTYKNIEEQVWVFELIHS